MNRRPYRILFQGDSITDAFRRPEEINPAYQLGNGYAFLVASRLAWKYPGRFEFLNRGISGQTARELAVRWETDALALKPDALSLLVGVNSTIRAMLVESRDSLADFQEVYRSLLSRMLEADSGRLLVLLEPFLLEAGKVNNLWCQHLLERQMVIRELAREFGAVFVPLQQSFDAAVKRAPASYWAYDGIHPTHAGAAVLAEAWLDAVQPVLEERFSVFKSTRNVADFRKTGVLP